MLFKHKLDLQQPKTIEAPKIKEIANFLSYLKVSDQLVRQPDSVWSISEARKVDSINFLLYRNYFNGSYPSLYNYTVNDKVVNPSELLMNNWVLQLHFSDRFAIPMMELISKSVDSGTCNQMDLMNYTIHYLWRSTEFPNKDFYGKAIHIVLLPDLTTDKFAQYYQYALQKYLGYCKEKDPLFEFEILNGIFLKNNQLDWSGVIHLLSTLQLADESTLSLISQFQYIISNRIIDANALSLKNGNYSILICNHPNINTNPPFVF